MPGVLVTHTAHFVRGPDGHVYAGDTGINYSFFSRYLTVFDRVGVAARVGHSDTIPTGMPRADGPGVEFWDLPDYVGPWRYLRCADTLRARLREAIEHYQAYCLRVPCAHATLAWHELRRRGKPFGLEVAGDPWHSLGPGSYKSILRPIARWRAARNLRTQCRTARATAYVTRETIQRHYPPDPSTFTTYYSSIELPPEAVVETPRTDFHAARHIIFVGSLAVLYKAPDILIRAVARIGRADLTLTIAGDGRERSRLETLAADLGIRQQTRFLGAVPPGEPVRSLLDGADLFVLPSRTEGLPRAMIEAMARGLPCIGSTAGGIPELLPPEDLVRPGDAEALARKILEFIDSPQRMQAAARRNLKASREYLEPTLAARRRDFYRELLRISEASSGTERR